MIAPKLMDEQRAALDEMAACLYSLEPNETEATRAALARLTALEIAVEAAGGLCGACGHIEGCHDQTGYHPLYGGGRGEEACSKCDCQRFAMEAQR